MRFTQAAFLCFIVLSQLVQAQDVPGLSSVAASERSKFQYGVEISLYSGETLVNQSAMVFPQGQQATVFAGRYTKRGNESIPGSKVVEKLDGLILIGEQETGFDRPEGFTDRLWIRFWNSANHVTLGKLHFFIYHPLADRVSIDAKLVSPDCIEYYGGLKAPISCAEIRDRLFRCEILGTREDEEVRWGELAFSDAGEPCVSMICTPEAKDGEKPRYPACFMMVLPAGDRKHSNLHYAAQALGDWLVPPTNSVVAGPFEFLMYFPEADKLTVSVWELEELTGEDWEETATFLGATSIANHQLPAQAL